MAGQGAEQSGGQGSGQNKRLGRRAGQTGRQGREEDRPLRMARQDVGQGKQRKTGDEAWQKETGQRAGHIDGTGIGQSGGHARATGDSGLSIFVVSFHLYLLYFILHRYVFFILESSDRKFGGAAEGTAYQNGTQSMCKSIPCLITERCPHANNGSWHQRPAQSCHYETPSHRNSPST